MPDQETLTHEFETIGPQLKSFILRMTASAEDTEDLMQDAYIKASQNLDKFRGDSSLKTWIFTIASNLAKDHLRTKKRWPENVTDICREAALNNPEFLRHAVAMRQTSPQADFEIREHIAFCFTCIGKALPLEQQIALLLKEVYEFKVAEIAGIMELTEGVVKHLLFNGRQKMIDIFENRCSLINKKGICHQCSELNGIFNPRQNFQEELMKIQMAQEAETSSKDMLFDLRTEIVRAIDPFNSGASTLQLAHLRHNKMVMDKYIDQD